MQETKALGFGRALFLSASLLSAQGHSLPSFCLGRCSGPEKSGTSGGDGGHVGLSMPRMTQDGLRPKRTEPTSSKPFLGDRELGPAAIQAHLDIWGGRHGRMTEGSRYVAKETNFGRNHRKGPRLTLWAHHCCTSRIRLPAGGKPTVTQSTWWRNEFCANFPSHGYFLF